MWSKIWGFITGLFGGGGGIVSTVGAGIKLADTIARDAHDTKQQAAGAAAQRDVTNAEVLHNVAAGNAAANDSDVLDLVRRRNEAAHRPK